MRRLLLGVVLAAGLGVATSSAVSAQGMGFDGTGNGFGGAGMGMPFGAAGGSFGGFGGGYPPVGPQFGGPLYPLDGVVGGSGWPGMPWLGLTAATSVPPSPYGGPGMPYGGPGFPYYSTYPGGGAGFPASYQYQYGYPYTPPYYGALGGIGFTFNSLNYAPFSTHISSTNTSILPPNPQLPGVRTSLTILPLSAAGRVSQVPTGVSGTFNEVLIR